MKWFLVMVMALIGMAITAEAQAAGPVRAVAGGAARAVARAVTAPVRLGRAVRSARLQRRAARLNARASRIKSRHERIQHRVGKSGC